jgi:tetratricopeptide (TPR) repeat protein
MILERQEKILLDKAVNEAVKNGEGSTIFITGEPGIGKTTFVNDYFENCSSGKENNILTGSGYCLDMDGVSKSYLPWKELLIDLDSGITAKSTSEDRKNIKKILKTVFDEAGADWIKAIPQIGEISAALYKSVIILNKKKTIDVDTGELVDFKLKDRIGKVLNECSGDWLSLIPVVGNVASAVFKTSKALTRKGDKISLKNQEDFFIQVMNKFRKIAVKNILLIYIDDLQWADISSLNLFYYLSKNLHDSSYPLILVGSYRPQDVAEGRLNPVTNTYERHPLEEKLNNLKRYNACSEISMGRFSEIETGKLIESIYPLNKFDDNFVNKIHLLTSGNALFLTELLKDMAEKGDITAGDGVFRNRENISFSEFPRSIEGVVNERYGRVPDETKEYLRIASVLGFTFPAEIIKDVLQENIIKVYGHIELLKNKFGILKISGGQLDKFTKVYEFTHNLFRSYIYNSIDPEFRLEYHKLIYLEYLKYYNDDAEENAPPFYSYHFGIGNKIIDENFNVIIKPENMNGKHTKNISVFLKFMFQLGKYYESSYSYDESLQNYELIIQLSELLNNDDVVSQYLIKKADILKLQGKWVECRESLVKSIEIADKNGNMEILAKAKNSIARLYELKGDYVNAEKFADESLNIYEKINHKQGIAEAYGNLSVIKMKISKLEEALDCANRQLNMSSELNDKKGIAFAAGNLAGISAESNDYESALKHYQTQLEIYTELRDKSGIAYATGNIGIVYFNKGDMETAMQYYSKQLKICNEIKDKRGSARTIGNIGVIYLNNGETTKAKSNFEQQVKLCRELGDKRGLTYAVINSGILYSEMGDNQKAVSAFNESLLLSEEISDKRAAEISRQYIRELTKQ